MSESEMETSGRQPLKPIKDYLNQLMFFGLCNSPATLYIYIDNIFIFTLDKPTLNKNTKKVLQQLEDNDLFLKLTKCEFYKAKVEYLGMIIEEGKILWTQEN